MSIFMICVFMYLDWMLRHSGPICPANMFPHPIEFWDAKAGCAILPGGRLLRFVDLRHSDNISGTNLIIQGAVLISDNCASNFLILCSHLTRPSWPLQQIIWVQLSSCLLHFGHQSCDHNFHIFIFAPNATQLDAFLEFLLIFENGIFDGENTNLVQEGNSDALEDDEENDAQRGREDENEEERNVRPQRWSTWDHFFM